MAVLSKHNIIGKVRFMTKQYAVSDTGKTYVNYGSGWKEHGKLKPGVTPEQYLKSHNDRLADIRATCSEYDSFVKLLHSAAPQNCRSMVLEALRILGDDVDGLWSEVNDHMGYEMRDRLSLPDCEELARSYKRYLTQITAFNAARKSA